MAPLRVFYGPYKQYKSLVATQYLGPWQAQPRHPTDWWRWWCWWWCLSTVSSNVDETTCASSLVTSCFFQTKTQQMTSRRRLSTVRYISIFCDEAHPRISRPHYPIPAEFCTQLIGKEVLAVRDQRIGSSPSHPRDSRPEMLQVLPAWLRGVPSSVDRPPSLTSRSHAGPRDDRVTTVSM